MIRLFFISQRRSTKLARTRSEWSCIRFVSWGSKAGTENESKIFSQQTVPFKLGWLKWFSSKYFKPSKTDARTIEELDVPKQALKSRKGAEKKGHLLSRTRSLIKADNSTFMVAVGISSQKTPKILHTPFTATLRTIGAGSNKRSCIWSNCFCSSWSISRLELSGWMRGNASNNRMLAFLRTMAGKEWEWVLLRHDGTVGIRHFQCTPENWFIQTRQHLVNLLSRCVVKFTGKQKKKIRIVAVPHVAFSADAGILEAYLRQ